VAKLRTQKTDDRWLLFKTEMEAGHGGQSGRFEALRELAEEYAFLLLSLAFADRDQAARARSS
jgi:oligopeptidase B